MGVLLAGAVAAGKAGAVVAGNIVRTDLLASISVIEDGFSISQL